MKPYLLLLALALAGCSTTPKVGGGRTDIRLPDQTVLAAKQGDNAETPTTQRIERTYTKTLPTPPTPFGPTRDAPVVESHREVIETSVGATQDVATIQKVVATEGGRKGALAVVMGIALAFVAYTQWKRQWWLIAVCSAIGSALSFVTLSPWVGLATAVLSLVVFLAYQFAKATVPGFAAGATIVESSIRPPDAK